MLFSIPASHWLQRKRYRHLQGHHIYEWSTSSHSCQPKSTFASHLPLGTRYLRYLQSITTNSPMLPLGPHVADLFVPTSSPPALSPSLGTQIWNQLHSLRLSSRVIRHQHHRQQYPPLIGPTPIDSKQWLTFWQLKLSPTARQVWYRLLHHKWPTHTMMHHRLPALYPNPHCPHCSYTLHDIHHMAISCPELRKVWHDVWHVHFPLLPFDPNHLWMSLLFLRPSPAPCLLSTPLWHQTIGSTLHAIWRAYWNHHFNQAPFRSTTITSNLRLPLSSPSISLLLPRDPVGASI
ncbi:unnamed protein product, partial [Absidia cylindrospora]